MSRQDWQAYLDELNRRQQQALAMGGESKIDKQRARGRWTVRERIAAALDPDTFEEIGQLVGGNDPGGTPPLAGDGTVGGTGRINGHRVVLLAEDFTVRGGTIGHAANGKRLRLCQLALEQGWPLLLMLDGAGERADNALHRYPFGPGDLQVVADLQGRVPVVTLILGTSAGHGALTGMFADLIIMNEGAALFTAGPPIVKNALGIDIDPEALGGAQMHASTSGIVHNVTGSESEAIALARDYLTLILAPRVRGGDTATRESPALYDIVPTDLSSAYDMHRVLADICDAGSLRPLQPDFGRSLIVALARIGGVSTLLIANQPAVQSGSVTREAAEKAAHFLNVARHHDLPVVFLADNPGVMIGPDAEQAGTLKAAAAMFAAQRRLSGKKIHCTLRKAFGFGSSIMAMNGFDRQVLTLAFPNISLGALPAEGAAQTGGAGKEERAKMLAAQSGAWVPADNGSYDRVIDPAQLRNELIAALAD